MPDAGSVAVVDQLHQLFMFFMIEGSLRVRGLAGAGRRSGSMGVDSGWVQAAPAVLESGSRAPAQQPRGGEHPPAARAAAQRPPGSRLDRLAAHLQLA